MPSPEGGDIPPLYAFVTKDNDRGGRSHALRAHWRQRRQRMEMRRMEREELEQRPLRMILPGPGSSENGGGSPRVSPILSEPPPRIPILSGENTADGNPYETPGLPDEVASPILDGIPGQALSGMNLALGCSRLDPFDRFPVRLTPRHHMLLHHWLATFAGMMFNTHTSTFNPMRDVWFPLDLSNAASFSAIMAHSAAHLAHVRGFPVPDEAVRFKLEAVRIVQSWAGDPALALSDDIIAAILRLLSFERYWGSEDEWRIHHNGLLHIIEARGGIATLQNNWRLEIATFLVTLMTKPSWFDSSNQLREISQQPVATHPVLGQLENLYKTRCIWLLSFVQDMRTFMNNLTEVQHHGLAHYASIRDALLVVESASHPHEEGTHTPDSTNEQERIRLACLFYICVMLQISDHHDNNNNNNNTADPGRNHLSIAAFDQFLASSGHVQWRDSIESLFQCLFHGPVATRTLQSAQRYALDLTNVLCSTSAEARRGVERCMLQILRQAATEGRTAPDYDWTLDSLLACIEGH